MSSGFWSFAWTEIVEQDLRYAVRGLARSPGFAATVAITFALGVGANAAVFSLIDPLLLRNPVAVAEPDRVHRVYYATSAGTPTPYFSGAAYASIRDALAGVAQVAPKLSSDSVSMGTAVNAPTIVREFATSNYLPLLAGVPALGRFFSRDEADAAAPLPRAVLSHALWLRAFGGDSAVLGREVALGAQVYAIVGVAPKGFSGVDLAAVDIWTTAVHFARLPEPWFRWSSEKFGQLVVRTARNVDERQVAARATQGYRRAIDDSSRSVLLGSIVEGRGPVASKEVLISSRVAGVAFIVLLVACANIATLSLVRAMRRRREIAVRVALGVSRPRLVAQLLTENLLLAVAGGALALLIAWWGGIALRNVLVPDLRLPTGTLSARVAGATLLLSLVAGVLAGLAPAISVSRPDLADVLKGGSRSNALRGPWLRTTLLVAQGALCVVLLVGAGLFLRSLYNVHAIDLGLDPSRTIVSSIRPTSSRGFAVAMETFTARVRQIHGVEHAGLGTSAPFVHWDAQDAFLPGQDTSASLGGERAAGIGIDGEFLNALGVRVHVGRGISTADGPGAPPVMVVTDAMAKALWPGENPIGKCVIPFARTNPCFSVVGVVSDLHQWSLVESARMRFFISMTQMPNVGRLPTSLVIRATQDRAVGVASLVQAEMRREFPTARIMWPAEPIERKLEPQLRPWRVGAALFAALGTLALFVATIGIYSVIAYSFSQRTHEIGVRMALGARSEDVRALVLAEGVRVVSVAAVLGGILSLAMGPLVASLLYGVSSRDPIILAASAIVVVAAGVAAGLLPALKAARVDPVISLRAE